MARQRSHSRNITGLTMLLTDLVAKELEIFKEAAPQATRIGILWNPANGFLDQLKRRPSK